MKVLQVNTYDFGGAAKACIRLHEGLLGQGTDSHILFKQRSMAVRSSSVYVPPSRQATLKERFWAKVHRIAAEFWLLPPASDISPEEVRQKAFKAQRPKGLDYYSYPCSPADITQTREYQEADIIHLHWVADFLDWPSFFAKNRKPMVWTLHDQNPFLGGQHYAERFLGMTPEGFPIERSMNAAELAEEERILHIKREALKNVSQLYVVCPSRWLMNSSQQSDLLGRFPHAHIPNGFPTNIFKPYDRAFCREVLGIPQSKKVLLFVSDSLTNQRKGYAYLLAALQRLQQPESNLFLCAIGNTNNEFATLSNVLQLGKIVDERLMAMAYSAADIFVIPSLEDNLPNTMIESLLCGTPVIGFPTGGIRETIQDSINGYLCHEISVAALAAAIEKFINNSDCFDRQAIAHEAREKYSLEVQAKAYIELYNQMLNV